MYNLWRQSLDCLYRPTAVLRSRNTGSATTHRYADMPARTVWIKQKGKKGIFMSGYSIYTDIAWYDIFAQTISSENHTHLFLHSPQNEEKPRKIAFEGWWFVKGFMNPRRVFLTGSIRGWPSPPSAIPERWSSPPCRSGKAGGKPPEDEDDNTRVSAVVLKQEHDECIMHTILNIYKEEWNRYPYFELHPLQSCLFSTMWMSQYGIICLFGSFHHGCFGKPVTIRHRLCKHWQ